MIFQARLKQVSATRRHWLAQRRLSGVLAGTVFRWQPGDDFVSEPLEAGQQIEHLRNLADVELAVMTRPVLASAAAFQGMPAQDDALARGNLQPPDAVHRMPVADETSADDKAQQAAKLLGKSELPTSDTQAMQLIPTPQQIIESSVETILPASAPADKYVPASQPDLPPPPKMRPPASQRPLPPSAWNNGKKR